MRGAQPLAELRLERSAAGARPGRGSLDAAMNFVRRKPLGALGALFLTIMVITAVLAPLIAPYDPLAQDIPNRIQPPSQAFWFGTDNWGRDVFSRIVHGTRISLGVGLGAVTCGTMVGVIAGVASAYLGGAFDMLAQRVVDGLMGIPPIVLALVMVVGLGPSLPSVTIAIALTLIPRMVRLSRSSALSVKQEMFVTAARASGGTDLRIIFVHLIPNSLAPVFVLATGYLGAAMVTEASLSFLGLGIPPPAPSWGGMLQFGAKNYLEAAPWLTVFPGLALSMGVFAFSLFGDALRDVLDPRLRGG